MVKVVGIRFRNAGKIYYFGPGKLQLKAGIHAIVETARGVEMGTVMTDPREVSEESVVQPLKPVIRIATEQDEKQAEKNRQKEKEAFKICLEKIAKHKLDMKLVEAEYTFDNNKLLFYFTADGRIDFRELVKDLAAVFRTRIELRQIGVRDETKIMGGYGICGRELCCHTFLSEFAPVSIKMAKEQNLSLNPTKISGVCGRLMCCLKNEDQTIGTLVGYTPYASLGSIEVHKAAMSVSDWHSKARKGSLPSMPSQGKVLTVDIPNTESNFTARKAMIYLPPAALSDRPPALPVMELLAGQPGSPSRLIDAGNIAATMNAYAAKHDGLAPIVLVPDQNGEATHNSLCADTTQGNAETYLTTDVVNWLSYKGDHLYSAWYVR